MTLNGKTYVVTGASRGIGRGITETLGEEDANVVVNYRSSEANAYDVVKKRFSSISRSIDSPKSKTSLASFDSSLVGTQHT